MLCLVNNLRISRGLMPVVYHDRLMRLAQAHSRFQAYYKVITHADTAGQIGDRLSTLGFDWGILLENVGAGANSEPGIVDAWSKSPGHLSNMLNPDVRYMGVDVFNGFWVQDFASPRDKGYVVPTSQIDACPSLSDLTIYY
ncbi:SCP-domain-containing protein [Martensiomyces pterosporus]|nr:SCP-domain-containing protein [Martensiomyces pterosporus]